MNERDRLIDAINKLPDNVVKALASTGASQETISAVAMANRRNSAKRISNRTTDTARRKTISARLSGKEVEYYRALAEASGRSMYRFVVDAIEAEARRTRQQFQECEQLTIDGWKPKL